MVGFLNGLGQFGTNAINGYQNMDAWMAAKRDADQKRAIAQAYGQAMQTMANPAAIDLGPLGGKVQPQVPDMTMQNFARAMPQGVSPETFGGAANQFLPTMKADSLGDYRSGMLEERARGNDLRSRGLDYRGQQVANQGRNIDSLIDSRSASTEMMRRKQIVDEQFKAIAAQREQDKAKSPAGEAAFKRLMAEYGAAVKRVAAAEYFGDSDKIAAALEGLDTIKTQLDSFDVGNVGIPPAKPAQPFPPPPMAASAPPVAPTSAPITPPPEAIRDLQANPALKDAFEFKYKQPAGKYLQPAPKPQSSLGAPPGPQGGPFVAMKSPVPSMTERNMLTSENIDPAVAQRLANRTADAGDIRSANQGINGQKPQGSMAGAGQTPALPGEPAPIDAGSWGQDDAVEAQKIQQELQKAGVVSEGMDLPELRIRRAMLNYRDNVGGAVKEAKAIAPRVSALANRNRPTEPTARPVTLRNPYMTMNETQRNAEMRRLSIQMYAAKTARERAEVDKKLEQLLKASSPRAASAPGA